MKELREDTILTQPQKDILLKTVVSDNISNQVSPTATQQSKSLLQTIQEKTGETTKTPGDLPFTAKEKESAGTATVQDKFSRRMDQRKEV